jgi:hypothetical protein
MKKTIINILFIFSIFVLIMYGLLGFYFERILWVFALLIPVIDSIVLLALSIIQLVNRSTREKKISLCALGILVIVISGTLIKYSVSEKISERIELAVDKYKLEKIKKGNYKNLDYKYSDKMYAFKYITGVIDNYSVIVYDDTGILENGKKMIETQTGYFTSNEYRPINDLFGGDLYSIKKIDTNWYICSFT